MSKTAVFKQSEFHYEKMMIFRFLSLIRAFLSAKTTHKHVDFTCKHYGIIVGSEKA